MDRLLSQLQEPPVSFDMMAPYFDAEGVSARRSHAIPRLVSSPRLPVAHATGARPAPMSGGGPSEAGKRAEWCGPEPEQSEGDDTVRRFPPAKRVALTALGSQTP